MAGGYDGDIKLSVSLDTNEVKASAKNLQSKISDIMNKSAGGETTKQFQKLEAQMDKTSNKASDLLKKLSDMEQSRVPTKEYQTLLDTLTEYKNRVSEIQKIQADTTGPNAKYNISDKVQAGLSSELADRKANITEMLKEQSDMLANGTAYQGGTGSAEYQKTSDALNAVNNQMRLQVEAANAATGADSGLSDSLRGVGDSCNDVTQKSASAASSVGKLVGTGIVKGASALSNGIRNTVSSLKEQGNGFKMSLRQILRYAIGVRSLFFLFRKLRAAIAVGIEDLKNFGSDANGTKANIQSLQATLKYLENAWAAAFAPIITMVTPWLNALMANLATVGNALAKFFAMLTGKSTYTVAVNNQEALIASLDTTKDSANDAADALKGELAPIDELNIIQNDSSKSGSSGGGGGTDTSGMFQNLTNDVGNVDFNAAGKKISDALTNMMLGIPWDKIFQTAKDWGKNLADFMNGLITPDLFYQVGRTLVNALNTAFYFLLSFATTFDWTNLGNSIAAGVNGFFENMDAASWANTIDAWVQGIYTAITTAVNGVTWETVWDKAKEFLSNLDIKTVEIVIGAITIKKVAGFVFGGGAIKLLSDTVSGSLSDMVSSAFGGGKVTESLSMGFLNAIHGAAESGNVIKDGMSTVGSFIGGLFDPGTLTETVEGGLALSEPGVLGGFTKFFTGIGDKLSGVFTGMSTGIGNALEGIAGKIATVSPEMSVMFSGATDAVGGLTSSITGGLGSALSGIATALSSPLAVFAIFIAIIAAVVVAIIDLWNNSETFRNNILNIVDDIMSVVQELWDKVLSPIFNFIIDILKSLWTNVIEPLYEVIKTIVAGVVQLITDLFNLFKPVFDVIINILGALLPPILQVLYVVFDTVFKAIGVVINVFKSVIEGIFWFLDKVFKGDWEGLWQGISDFFGKIWNTMCKVVNGAVDAVTGFLDNMSEAFRGTNTVVGSVMSAIFEVISDVIKAIKRIFGGIIEFITGVFTGNWEQAWQGVCDVFGGIWDGIVGIVRGAVNLVIGIINSMIGAVEGGLNWVIDGLDNIGFDIPDWLGGGHFGIDIGEVSFGRIPYLAQGAVIPPNKKFAAILGDQTSGTNIEAPLDTIKQAVAEVLATGTSNQETVALLKRLIEIVDAKQLSISKNDVGKSAVDYINGERNRTGNTPILI